MNPKPTIAIIGGGFCGTMTAVHLLTQSRLGLHVILINSGYPLAKGVAYSSYSQKHPLNVSVKNMSAFPDEPHHFMEWIKAKGTWSDYEEGELREKFVPRNVYGEYVKEIFENAIRRRHEGVTISFVHDEAIDVECVNGSVMKRMQVQFAVSPSVEADMVVLATGNHLPANPLDSAIGGDVITGSRNYFGNPWLHEAVKNLDEQEQVLIIGNGLTMVDVVLGLLEKKHKGKIFSVSPGGFKIIPHHEFEPYTALVDELEPPYELIKLVGLFSKHVHLLQKKGLTAAGAVDSLRPLTQKIWAQFSVAEKKRFMHNLRYTWGVVRHRLPMEVHRQIQKLILDDRLETIAGRIVAVKEKANKVLVKIKRKIDGEDFEIEVGRIINCTGPVLDITKMKQELIQNLLKRKFISPDELRMGILARADGTIIDADGKGSETFFTLGSTLKGTLWETTAVPELRVQAKNLAGKMVEEFLSRKRISTSI